MNPKSHIPAAKLIKAQYDNEAMWDNPTHSYPKMVNQIHFRPGIRWSMRTRTNPGDKHRSATDMASYYAQLDSKTE